MDCGEYQNSYLKRKNLLVASLREVAAIAEDLHITHEAEKILDDVLQLENESFHLVVVGEFSRGKSTFINALLGRRILPSSSSPTTAVISKLVYGTDPFFCLHFRDGKRQVLNEDDFKDLKAPKAVLEDTAEAVQKAAAADAWIANIDHAEVKYPLEFCKNNVEIIDTPGVNDISKERVEITYRYLNQADAAILLLSAKQVLSKSEIAFLKEHILGNQINNIFVVINFKDAIEQSHWREVVEYTRQHLAENLPDRTLPQIFLVSSKQALLYRRNEHGEPLSAKLKLALPADMAETGMVEFEAELKQFLFTEKGKAKLKKYVGRGIGYTREINKRISSQISDLSHSTEDLQEKLRHMRPLFDDTKYQARQIAKQLETSLRNHEPELMIRCNNGLDTIQAAAEKSVDGYKLGMDRKEILELIQTEIAPLQKKFYKDIEDFQNEKINTDVQATIKTINQLWNNLEIDYGREQGKSLVVSRNSLETVNVEEEQMSDDEALATIVTGSVVVGGVVAAAIFHPFLLLGGLIFGFGNVGKVIGNVIGGIMGLFTEDPTAKTKHKIKRSLRATFAEQNEKIRTEISRVYVNQCSQVSQSIATALNGKVDDLEGQLQATIKQKEDKEADVVLAIKRLTMMQETLRKKNQSMNEVIL